MKKQSEYGNYDLFKAKVKQSSPAINKILDYIYIKTRNDFRLYRDTTMYRRISRRFYFSKTIDFESYYNYLIKNDDELYSLIKYLTINVTSFFRDEEYWQIFEAKYIEDIFRNVIVNNKDELNIWSAGCSSGEETYSLAIIFDKYIKENNLDIKLNIVATDINIKSLQKARQGVYSKKSIIETCASKYLNQYIDIYGTDGVIIRRRLKKMINFRYHSIVNDIYFTNIDFIICRNVFIYLLKPLQMEIIKKFNSSLNPGGMIWLGKAEAFDTVNVKDLIFLDKRIKLFLKKS